MRRNSPKCAADCTPRMWTRPFSSARKTAMPVSSLTILSSLRPRKTGSSGSSRMRRTPIPPSIQFGNAIFAGDARFFIDLGDFCYGYPLFDVGMVYCTAFLSEPDFVKEAFHMEPGTALRFWQAFAPAYFGTDRPLRDIESEVRPFAGLKTIIVERDMGRPMPTLRAALTSILQP